MTLVELLIAAENYLHKTVVGLNTTWNLETTNMEPGTRYYVSVRAQNEAGLHTTAVSDGIIVDVTAPTVGVVFNTDRHVNRHSQNSGTVLSASWHGFEDRHSGVTSYYVSVYDVENTTMSLLADFHAGFKNKYTHGWTGFATWAQVVCVCVRVCVCVCVCVFINVRHRVCLPVSVALLCVSVSVCVLMTLSMSVCACVTVCSV